MTKKKTRFPVERKGNRIKKNSKDIKRKPDTITNSIISQNRYKYLQSKFKLKELSIILHDVIADNESLLSKKSSVSNNISSVEVNDKCEKYSCQQKIYSRDTKPSNNDILNIECSNKISSELAIRKCNKKKIIEKQNINDEFDIQTKLLNAKGQETYFHKSIESLSNSGSNNNKKKRECTMVNDVDSTKTSINTDPSEIFILEVKKQNKNFNEQNEETFIMNRDLMKSRCSIVETNEKLLNETQKTLINQKDVNKIYNQSTLKERDLPKITEDKILAKNTILLKTSDNLEVRNNLQHAAYYTNVILESKNNECLSIDKRSRVVDLTEDNLYKFLESYRSFALEENAMSLNTTENLESSPNSNNIEIPMKMNKDDLQVPHRKRGWITQKATTERDRTCSKRIKLNRKCIQEQICTTTNSSACSSYDKNSNSFFKSRSININNDKLQNRDNCLTLYSSNDNSLCTIQLVSESTKVDFDNISGSTHIVERSISNTIVNGENEKNELLSTEKYHQSVENIVDNNLNESKILSCNTQLDPQNHIESQINDNCDYGNNDIGTDDIDHKDDSGGNDVDHKNDGDGDDVDHKNDGDGDDVDHKNDGGDDDIDHKNDSSDDDNNNENSGDSSNCNNDDDDDCISLFTDSLLSVDLMPVPCNENKKKDTFPNYTMTGNTFDKYLEQNILECNKEFDTFDEHSTLNDKSYQKLPPKKCEEIKQKRIPALERLSVKVESTDSVNTHITNNNNSLCPNQNYNEHKENYCNDEVAMTYTEQMESTALQALCRGYCFPKMRHGDCNRTPCYFNHNLQELITDIILKYKQYLVSIMNYMHSTRYHYCLKILYFQCLQDCNVNCIMDLFKTLYLIQNANSEIVYVTVKALLHKGVSSKDVVDSLAKILTPTDKWTPQYIINSVKENIKVGEHWNTLRSLLTHVKPTREVIESILNDCLTTRQHIQDVYINLIKGLHQVEVNQLNKDLMLSFYNLVKHEYQKIPDKTSPKSVNNNEGSSTESYLLHSISDLPETHSLYRDRFWKLYLMIYNIKEALAHEDYDYVISILDKYEETNENESLFTRCCFHMLTAEIKHSEYHISKIIEHAVQIGASSILYKVLLDIATYVLMKLTIENAWTLAYKLLKTLQIYNLQHSAAFIILSAEIYLANKHAIKALMLIKQSNIISTNRDNWNVVSNEQDYYPRTNIINILLDVLCIQSPEHAFFIFQFLTKDQGNNFRPIDLTYYVDKLMLKLLIEREIDLIVKMGYVVIEYNFTFFNITICRAAIASIVHVDMVLAKQLYQYACGLGIYRTIELLPIIHVIINVDWVEEEIYLTFWDLFQRLVMDIGHSMDHLNPSQLSIYIIFQIVPTEAHLYYDNLDDQQIKKIQVSKKLVQEVLLSRFEPSISFSKKKANGSIIKLQNKLVINHLKAIYKNYTE